MTEFAIPMSALMEAISEKWKDDAGSPPKPQPIQARVLLDSYAKLSETFEKTPGLPIVAKKGLYNGYKHHADSVFVITRVFETPITGDAEEGSIHFGRELDIAVLGIQDGDIVEWVVDSRFFEPYRGSVE